MDIILSLDTKIMKMGINFTELKIAIQSAIDYLALNDKERAIVKLDLAKEVLENLTDCAINDNDLIELSKYQVLLNQLQLKAKI